MTMIQNPSSRSESLGYYYHNNIMMEKRQLFLRSYQFSRKKSLSERIKGSLAHVKKVMCPNLKSAKKLKKFVFSRFRIKLCAAPGSKTSHLLQTIHRSIKARSLPHGMIYGWADRSENEI
ncbi:unnamed protein product [Lupinus luteus]|uniref:Uncharacterized protein n=1 Tax=Lupinus luteus TaxID=3873 RepID=A0AAV1WPD2_LUPLU